MVGWIEARFYPNRAGRIEGLPQLGRTPAPEFVRYGEIGATLPRPEPRGTPRVRPLGRETLWAFSIDHETERVFDGARQVVLLDRRCEVARVRE